MEKAQHYTPMNYSPSRRDYFAAKALQGLLASGKFTEKTEDGEWAILERADQYDAEGNETGRQIIRPIAPELAWRLADWMIEMETKPL